MFYNFVVFQTYDDVSQSVNVYGNDGQRLVLLNEIKTYASTDIYIDELIAMEVTDQSGKHGDKYDISKVTTQIIQL